MIAVVFLIVMLAYFSFEMTQKSSLDQAVNERNILEHATTQEKITASVYNSAGALNVQITNEGSAPVTIVSIIVGTAYPNNVIQSYNTQLMINSGGKSSPFPLTGVTNTGPLWVKVISSRGTVAMALYPLPNSGSGNNGGGGSATVAGAIGDVYLNFESYTWYKVVDSSGAPCQAFPCFLSPAKGPGYQAFTMYTDLVSSPYSVAFSVQVEDVNLNHYPLILDSNTMLFQYWPNGASIRSGLWFITSNQSNVIQQTYTPIVLPWGQIVTIVFADGPSGPCTNSCQPATNFTPQQLAQAGAPTEGLVPTFIFVHGWKNEPTTATPNWGQNLPFTSTAYLTPSISLSPTTGPVGTPLTVIGYNFFPSSTITITYAGSLVATITARTNGTFSVNFPVPLPGTNTVTATDSLGNTASATFSGWDFTISASQSTTSVQNGSSRTLSNFITVTSINGFTGTVTLSTSISPSSGLTGTLSPTTITLGTVVKSTLTLTASALGAYTLTITGTSGTISHSVIVTVSVPIFSISPGFGIPGTLITLSGGSDLPNTTYNYCLSTSSTSVTCVAGTSFSFTSNSAGNIPSGTILTVPSSATAGADYVIVYTTTNSYITSVASFEVQDFSISANPTTATITAGGPSGNSTISVSSINGFSGTVTLSLGISPSSGLTASLSPTSITGAGTSTLTFSSSVAGTYTITITGTSGGDVYSITVTVTVNSAGTSTSISCVPSPQQVGSYTTCTATVSGLGPTGTITFSGGGTGGSFSPSTTCTLSSGSCSVKYTQTSGGTATIIASYSGDSNNGPSSTSTTVTFQSTTTIIVSCTPSILGAGSSTTCTATVSGSSPTGTVTFSESGGGSGAAFNPSSGQCTLTSGSCSVTYTQSSAGSVSISATYSGDTYNLGSTSSPFSVTFDTAAVVQSQYSSCTSTYCSVSFSNSVSGGNVIMVAIATNNNSPSCVTVSGVGDSLSNSYTAGPTAIASSTTSGSCSESSVYYALIGTGGSDTVTVTLSGTPSDAVIVIYEVSGITTSVTSSSGTCNDTCGTSLSTSTPFSYSSSSFVIDVGVAYGQTVSGPGICTATYGSNNEYVGYFIPSSSSSNAFTQTTNAAPTTWANLVVEFAV